MRGSEERRAEQSRDKMRDKNRNKSGAEAGMHHTRNDRQRATDRGRG